ncbi:MAG: hypothetical protein AMXMBFR47_19270 [Planctomycetota bacterium]
MRAKWRVYAAGPAYVTAPLRLCVRLSSEIEGSLTQRRGGAEDKVGQFGGARKNRAWLRLPIPSFET